MRLAKAEILAVEWCGNHLIGRIDGEEEDVLVRRATFVLLDLGVLDDEAIMPGPSIFDFSLSAPPPPGSEGQAPPKQKTKTDRFLTVT